jgi:copper homeostasis protein CutC
MNFSTASKKNREIEQRIQRIVDLSRRREQILGVAEVDLEALAILAADYEAAHLHRIAVELRRRLEYYQDKGKHGSFARVGYSTT